MHRAVEMKSSEGFRAIIEDHVLEEEDGQNRGLRQSDI